MNKRLAFLAFGLLTVLVTRGIIQAEAKVTNKRPFQRWIKKGRIMAPGFAGPKSQGRVSVTLGCAIEERPPTHVLLGHRPGPPIHLRSRSLSEKSLRMEACNRRACTRALSGRKYQRQRSKLSLGDSARGWYVVHVLRHLGILGAAR